MGTVLLVYLQEVGAEASGKMPAADPGGAEGWQVLCWPRRLMRAPWPGAQVAGVPGSHLPDGLGRTSASP